MWPVNFIYSWIKNIKWTIVNLSLSFQVRFPPQELNVWILSSNTPPLFYSRALFKYPKIRVAETSALTLVPADKNVFKLNSKSTRLSFFHNVFVYIRLWKGMLRFFHSYSYKTKERKKKKTNDKNIVLNLWLYFNYFMKFLVH